MNYIVSFCTPVFNSSVTTYQYVKKVLSNPNPGFQLVISDNASEDDLLDRLKTIKDTRLKIVAHKERVSAERNWYQALEAGDGEYLYFVIGRDKLNPRKIDELIQILLIAKEQNISLLKDGPCGKRADEHKRMVVFSGAEAIKRFLGVEHPTGLIYRRSAYRNIRNRRKYYDMADTYPENWIQRDLLKNSCAAKISANVYCGKTNVNLKKVKSRYKQGEQVPFWYPQKRVESNIRILNMVEYSHQFHFTKREYDDLFCYRCNKAMDYVSYHWRSCLQNRDHAGHYGHEVRKVGKAEMICNIIKAYNTIIRYYGSEISFTRKIRIHMICMKKIVGIVIGFKA